MYFVTICTHKRQSFFGHIVNEEMHLTSTGEIVQTHWLDLTKHHSHIELDEFIIMPNHLHGLISILDSSSKSIFLGSIINWFKAGVSRSVKQNSAIEKLWQRNYYEHVVRNEKDYERIYEYISTNIIKWELDSLNPGNRLQDPLCVENP